jgi:hypothetical protein
MKFTEILPNMIGILAGFVAAYFPGLLTVWGCSDGCERGVLLQGLAITGVFYLAAGYLTAAAFSSALMVYV